MDFIRHTCRQTFLLLVSFLLTSKRASPLERTACCSVVHAHAERLTLGVFRSLRRATRALPEYPDCPQDSLPFFYEKEGREWLRHSLK